MSLNIKFIDEISTNKNKYIININGINYTAYIDNDRTISVEGTKITAEIMNTIINEINKKLNTSQGTSNANKVAITDSNGEIIFVNKIPSNNLPSTGVSVETAKNIESTDGTIITGDEIKGIKENVSDVLTTEVICKHAIEITGNTGDEHGLAIEDQQMLLNKIQGQTFNVNQLVPNKTFESNIADTKSAFDFLLQSYTHNDEYISLTPYQSYLLNATNFKLEGIVTMPDNAYTLTLKHSGSTADINIAYLYTMEEHSNHKMLYSLFIEKCDVQNIGGVKADDIMVIDLTQMFGAGKEPATVEEFYSRYNGGYIPYNEGTFKHSKCNLISTGRNLWDEEWEHKWLNENTGEFVEGTYVCSKNFINVLPNIEIFYRSLNYPAWFAFYDKNKQFISAKSYLGNSIITTPSNCYYTKMQCINYLNSYQNDICINVSDSSFNGTYEPYKEEIFVVNEEFKAFDYAQSGNLVKATGEYTFTGNESCGQLYGDYPLYQVMIPTLNIKNTTTNLIIKGFTARSVSLSFYTVPGVEAQNGNLYFQPDPNEITSYQQLIKKLEGLTLYYELATPTVTDITLPSGYAVYKGGMQIQDGEVPYILTKEYSLSLKAQVLTNVEIDREQQAQINELKKNGTGNNGSGSGTTIRSFTFGASGGGSDVVSFNGEQDANLLFDINTLDISKVGNSITIKGKQFGAIEYITTPPTNVNTVGLKIVMLNSSIYPQSSVTQYNGYIYMWY